MTNANTSRGDTLVEVIVSFAVFAVVAVSVSVLMNRGLAIGQQSLELALVREQISAQAEMLRFARYDTENPAVWNAVTSGSRLVGGGIASAKPTDCETVPPSSAFVLHPTTGGRLAVRGVNAGSYTGPTMSSFVAENGQMYGLWVQAARAENRAGGGPDAYDFYIHACWYAPSSDAPQTVTTSVRLYG